MGKRLRRLGLRAAAAVLAVTGAVVGVNVANAPRASAAWENCGDYICTTYFTRDETRAVAQYLNNVTPYSNGAVVGFCGFIGAKGGPLGAAVASGVCAELAKRYDWRDAANSAAQENACFQVAYRRDWWGRLIPTPGKTNHPSYCSG